MRLRESLFFILLFASIGFAQAAKQEPKVEIRPQSAEKECKPVPGKQETGKVLIEAVVSGNGRVKSTKVVYSDHKSLEGPAVERIRKWIFEPAQKNGPRVAVLVNIEVCFQ